MIQENNTQTLSIVLTEPPDRSYNKGENEKRALIGMPSSTIREDEGVREETTRIAAEAGLNFNAVMYIMARKFNAKKGFPFPVRLENEKRPFTVSLCRV